MVALLLLLLLLLILLLSVIIQGEESFQGRLAQRKTAVSSDGKKTHLDYLNSVQVSAYTWMNSFESNHYKLL